MEQKQDILIGRDAEKKHLELRTSEHVQSVREAILA